MVLADATALPYRSGILPLDQRGGVVSPTKSRGDAGVAIGSGMGKVIILPASGTGLKSGPVSQAERDFWLQQQDFLAIPSERLAPYVGQFVASRFGQIVDHDVSLDMLTNRFFSRFGDVPVYITKVGGDDDELRIDTPFFE